MRCKGCDRVIFQFYYNGETGEWTELCGVCREAGKVTKQHYIAGSFVDYEEDRQYLVWDNSRGPRPACLDWSDEQILQYLYRAFGLEDDFELLNQLSEQGSRRDDVEQVEKG